MLARRLPGILPPLAIAEAITTTKIASVAGVLPPGSGLLRERPFRAPHHTISTAGLVGGGQPVRPGEASLAHHGILFLDELPEFRRTTLEVLRQPMEEGSITIVRAAGAVTYPAQFSLVAGSNPCACGYLGDGRVACRCREHEIRAYLSRLSGPLIDRIDLQVDVGRVATDELLADHPVPPSESERVRSRVVAARARATERLSEESGVFANAQLGPRLVRRHCVLKRATRALLRGAGERLALTARSIHRMLKVSRTIADLDGATEIEERHLSEALQYRSLERAWVQFKE
jgi:magnesium chelatase family protein